MGFSPSRSTAGSARDAIIRQDFDQKDFDWEDLIRLGRFDLATPSNALIKQRFDQAKHTLRVNDNSAGQERPTILASDPTTGRNQPDSQPDS
jgi:hypothetical protein